MDVALLPKKYSNRWRGLGRSGAGSRIIRRLADDGKRCSSAGRLDAEKKLFKERGVGRGVPRFPHVGRLADDGKRWDSLSPAMDVARWGR